MAAQPGTLVVTDLVKRYLAPAGEVTILAGVSFTAAPGDTVAIVGPSGSGKSTLLNLLGTLDQPTSGSIHLDHVEVTTLAGHALAEFRGRRLGFIFQDHHLLPQLTALENVLLPTLGLRRDRAAPGRAQALLERMGVGPRAGAFPGQLSGGERQRVAAARALINGAHLLLCDEPTGNLDREAGANLVSLLLELAAEGVIVVMVTHNEDHAARFGRILALREGRLLPPGSSGAAGVG